VRFV